MGVGHVLCWMNFGGLPQDKIRRSMELFAKEVMCRISGNGALPPHAAHGRPRDADQGESTTG